MGRDPDAAIAREFKLAAIMFLVFAAFACLGWMFFNVQGPFPTIVVGQDVTHYFPYHVALAFLLLLAPARLLHRLYPPRRTGIAPAAFLVLATSGVVLAAIHRYTSLLEVVNSIVDGLHSVPDLLR